MLVLTKTQANILGTFLEYYREKDGTISDGIVSHALEKLGIVPKTFRNHREYLLKNYFLRLSKVEYHGCENWYFFQITKLGILAYIKWRSTLPSTQEFFLDKDFFPLLWKHWDKLTELYSDILIRIARTTIDQIDVIPQIDYLIGGEKFYAGNLIENIHLPLGSIKIRFSTVYHIPKVEPIPQNFDLGTSKKFQSLNPDIDKKIDDHYTFLIYFNLLSLGLDLLRTGEFFLSDILDNIKTIDEVPTDYDKMRSDGKIFGEKVFDALEALLLIIKNDQELVKLIKDNVCELKTQLERRNTFNAILESLD